jgi:hypothetical protein
MVSGAMNKETKVATDLGTGGNCYAQLGWVLA